MTNANSFRSAIIALLLFCGLYFVALGIYEIKQFISKKLSKKGKED